MDITSKCKYDWELLFITAQEEESFMKQKGAEAIQKQAKKLYDKE